jgi:hypothetical protein
LTQPGDQLSNPLILAARHFQQHISMTTSTFAAAKLPFAQRIELTIGFRLWPMPPRSATWHPRTMSSRKFVYQQKNRALEAITDAFAPTAADDKVLFYLPVTKVWLHQVVLALTLICHSSYRGVVEFMRDILGISISVHNLHQLSAQ